MTRDRMQLLAFQGIVHLPRVYYRGYQDDWAWTYTLISAITGRRPFFPNEKHAVYVVTQEIEKGNHDGPGFF